MIRKLLYIVLAISMAILLFWISACDSAGLAGQAIEGGDIENMETNNEIETTPDIQVTPTNTPAPTPDLEYSVREALEPAPEALPLFGLMDAHVDTISRAFGLPPENRSLYSNPELDVDFKRLLEFGAPLQFFALWTSNQFVDDVFNYTNALIDFFEEQVNQYSDVIEIARNFDDVVRISRSGRISAIISIEGGDALLGDINNLYHFYNRGVRSVGLLWNRENELGFSWAQNADQGLTPFGIEVVERMEELGMIVDVSHLNEAGFWDVVNISTRPFIASHSNAYALASHGRNLSDEQIMAIVESGGFIGLNMFPRFVTGEQTATMDDIIAQFRHFIELGAGYNIALGSDFDGIPTLPEGITDVSSLMDLHERLTTEFGEEVAFRIMEGNFLEFLTRYFRQEFS